MFCILCNFVIIQYPENIVGTVHYLNLVIVTFNFFHRLIIHFHYLHSKPDTKLYVGRTFVIGYTV